MVDTGTPGSGSVAFRLQVIQGAPPFMPGTHRFLLLLATLTACILTASAALPAPAQAQETFPDDLLELLGVAQRRSTPGRAVHRGGRFRRTPVRVLHGYDRRRSLEDHGRWPELGARDRRADEQRVDRCRASLRERPGHRLHGNRGNGSCVATSSRETAPTSQPMAARPGRMSAWGKRRTSRASASTPTTAMWLGPPPSASTPRTTPSGESSRPRTGARRGGRSCTRATEPGRLISAST